MKSVTKYISLLAIAMLAVSALGGLAALAPKENHNPGESFTLDYVVGESVYIDEKTKLALAYIFGQKGLNASEFYTIDRPYSPFDESEFITFNKGNLLINGVVSKFDCFDNATKTVNFTDDTYTITVYQ